MSGSTSVAQSYLTLCDPYGLEPIRLLCPWGFSRNTGVGCHALLQGIFPVLTRDRTQVSCIGRWILYHRSHEGRPDIQGPSQTECTPNLVPELSSKPTQHQALPSLTNVTSAIEDLQPNPPSHPPPALSLTLHFHPSANAITASLETCFLNHTTSPHVLSHLPGPSYHCLLPGLQFPPPYSFFHTLSEGSF